MNNKDKLLLIVNEEINKIDKEIFDLFQNKGFDFDKDALKNDIDELMFHHLQALQKNMQSMIHSNAVIYKYLHEKQLTNINDFYEQYLVEEFGE